MLSAQVCMSVLSIDAGAGLGEIPVAERGYDEHFNGIATRVSPKGRAVHYAQGMKF